MKNFFQVYARYGNVTDIVIDDDVVVEGTNSFFTKLEEAMENKIKKLLPSTKPRKTVRHASSTVGVQLEQYRPDITQRDQETMEAVREAMASIFSSTNPRNHDWEEILKDLEETFNLQRDELVDAADEIREREIKAREQEKAQKKKGTAASGHASSASNARSSGNKSSQLGGNSEDDEGESESDPDQLDNDVAEESLLKNLRKRWPFLFTYKGLTQHALKLTDRDLMARYTRFEEDHLELMLIYMVTSTTVNVTNLIIQHRIEKYVGPIENRWKFLLLLEMLANHFEESFDRLILTCDVGLTTAH